MIEVIINDTKQYWSEINPSWIHDQVRGRQEDGQLVCVRILVRSGPINLTLSAGACPSSGGGGRRPNPQEQQVFSLWDQFGMNGDELNSGRLVAFLKKLETLSVLH